MSMFITRCSLSLQMPAWFDIRGLGPTTPEDEDGIVKAALALNELVDKEIAAGIPPNRIVIGELGLLYESRRRV